MAVAVQRLRGEAGLAGDRHHPVLVDGRRQHQCDVQASGDAADLDRRRVRAERVDQGVATSAVPGAGAAQMTIERARLDEVGERGLGERCRAEIHVALDLGELGHQAARRHDPSQPQRRAHTLRHAACSEHRLGGQGMQRRQRLTVVAVLGVVVVLDDQTPGARSPLDQRMAASCTEGHTGRVLVRRRHHHGRRLRALERRDVDALVIDRHPHHVEAPPGQLVDRAFRTRIFTGDHGRRCAIDPLIARQQLCDARQGLREPVHDQHLIDRRGDAAHAPEVRRERRPELDRAAHVSVRERRVGQRCRRPRRRTQPFTTREHGRVRLAGIVPCHLLDDDPGRRWRWRRSFAHPGAAAGNGHEVALGHELGVGIHHQTTRHPEVGGESTCRRQGCARLE